MTVRELKNALNSFNENEQECEVVLCLNPDKDICKDYAIEDGGCSMQFNRTSNKWKAVFYITEK